MTGSEISNIVATVGIAQLVCDLLAKWLVYNKEPYQRACHALERARWKLNKAEADFKKNEKHAKKLQRAREDWGEACSDVARRHTAPGVWSSVFFVILLRILGTEHRGKVIGLLPFVPFTMLARVTSRGLDWTDIPESTLDGRDVDHRQAASFLFIYVLGGLSVKFFVGKLIGTQPPPGADRGILTMMESRQGQKLMKSFGIDPDDLKME